MADGSSQVVCFRLDHDEVASLDGIAKGRRLSRSELLREVVVDIVRSLGEPRPEHPPLPDGEAGGLAGDEVSDGDPSGPVAPGVDVDRVGADDEVLTGGAVEGLDDSPGGAGVWD